MSIGMYEHVGRSQLDQYVDVVRRLLRPGGLFLNHGIARLTHASPRADTFISRYIFPGGELHPVADIVTSMQAAGLEVRDRALAVSLERLSLRVLHGFADIDAVMQAVRASGSLPWLVGPPPTFRGERMTDGGGGSSRSRSRQL